MDKQAEELQSLGVVGICRESCKLMVANRRIFSQIALALVLPLSFFSLLFLVVSDVVSSKIVGNSGAPGWILFFPLFNVVASVVFSLLSTSTVVYAVACVYSTKKDVSFRDIIAVVPKVWVRQLITYLVTYGIIFLIIVGVMVPTTILYLLLPSYANSLGITILITIAITILLIFFVSGFMYSNIAWYLVNVVTILEADKRGLAALVKSTALAMGKKWTVAVVFLSLGLPSLGLQWVFNTCVVRGVELGLGLGPRLVLAAVMLCLTTVLMLLSLVVQTMVYLVCKSHHRESIHESILLDHLDPVRVHGYEPLNGTGESRSN